MVDRGQRGDAKVRMDGPHPLRDVAHVGGGGRHAPWPVLGEIHVAAERGPVGGEEPCQPLVIAELRIARAGLGQLPLAPGCDGARLEARPHSREGAVELGQRVRADVPGATGQVGDRVGGRAGLGDDAVHAHRRSQLLPEQADGDLRDRESVSRVATEMGVGARVRGDAPVGDVEVGHGAGPGVDGVSGAGVDHHRERQVVEAPRLQHGDLPAAALFGRGAEHPDADAQVGGDTGEGLGRAHGGRRDDVVTAGVAEPGEGVVLRHEADRDGPFAVSGDERSGQARGPALDGETAGRQLIGQERRRCILPPGRLGVLVQPAADAEQRAEPLIDRVGHPPLQRLLRHQLSPIRHQRFPGTP